MKYEKANEGTRYVDMSIAQLENEIKEEQDFYGTQRARSEGDKYENKYIQEHKSSIEYHEQRIAEKKADYLEWIKREKQMVSQAKKEIKNQEKRIKEQTEFITTIGFNQKLLIEIKNNLEKNPNHYKEEDK